MISLMMLTGLYSSIAQSGQCRGSYAATTASAIWASVVKYSSMVVCVGDFTSRNESEHPVRVSAAVNSADAIYL